MTLVVERPTGLLRRQALEAALPAAIGVCASVALGGGIAPSLRTFAIGVAASACFAALVLTPMIAFFLPRRMRKLPRGAQIVDARPTWRPGRFDLIVVGMYVAIAAASADPLYAALFSGMAPGFLFGLIPTMLLYARWERRHARLLFIPRQPRGRSEQTFYWRSAETATS